MKLRWKIDFAAFQTFSRLSQVTQLLKRRKFKLRLKIGDSAGVQTKMVEFIALPFPFSSQLGMWSFHVALSLGRQSNLQKCVMHVQSCCCTFWRSRYRRLHSFVRSLIFRRCKTAMLGQEKQRKLPFYDVRPLLFCPSTTLDPRWFGLGQNWAVTSPRETCLPSPDFARTTGQERTPRG